MYTETIRTGFIFTASMSLFGLFFKTDVFLNVRASNYRVFLCKNLADLGYHVFAIDYRGSIYFRINSFEYIIIIVNRLHPKDMEIRLGNLQNKEL